MGDREPCCWRFRSDLMTAHAFLPHPLYAGSKEHSVPDVERGLISLDLLLGDSQ